MKENEISLSWHFLGLEIRITLCDNATNDCPLDHQRDHNHATWQNPKWPHFNILFLIKGGDYCCDLKNGFVRGEIRIEMF